MQYLLVSKAHGGWVLGAVLYVWLLDFCGKTSISNSQNKKILKPLGFFVRFSCFPQPAHHSCPGCADACGTAAIIKKKSLYLVFTVFAFFPIMVSGRWSRRSMVASSNLLLKNFKTYCCQGFAERFCKDFLDKGTVPTAQVPGQGISVVPIGEPKHQNVIYSLRSQTKLILSKNWGLDQGTFPTTQVPGQGISVAPIGEPNHQNVIYSLKSQTKFFCQKIGTAAFPIPKKFSRH